jgi:hypothetical protein
MSQSCVDTQRGFRWQSLGFSQDFQSTVPVFQKGSPWKYPSGISGDHRRCWHTPDHELDTECLTEKPEGCNRLDVPWNWQKQMGTDVGQMRMIVSNIFILYSYR